MPKLSAAWVVSAVLTWLGNKSLSPSSLKSSGNVTNSTTSNETTSYTLLASTTSNRYIPVHKYITTKTGLHINIVETEGPLVKGYFCLATETLDNDGLPHTLEHLTFMGSEDYPYKGLLDIIANRCFGGGLNAFVESDHTCYTTSQAGKAGFLALLPIYLEHIFFSTLTYYGFLTEVHHVNGDGMDGGVVYSEREGGGQNKVFDAMVKAMYKNSGYTSDTGGSLKNLRESTNHPAILEYHKKYYRPENICITVCGDVNIDDIMASIANIENKIKAKILSDRKLPQFIKPWQTPIAPIETQVLRPVYPSQFLGTNVYVAWRGPNCVTEYRKLVACTMVLEYLCSSSISPAHRYFVDQEQLSLSVGYETIPNIQTTLFFKFNGVAVDTVDLLFPKLDSMLRNITSGIQPIDMNRMQEIIGKQMLSLLSSLETSPATTLSKILVRDFMYGKSTDDFKAVLNCHDELDFLLTVNETYWTDCLNEYFVNQKHVVSIGVPSKEALANATIAEDDRINLRITKLGSKGLKKKSNELAKAVAFNSRPMPKKYLNAAPKPNSTDFHFHAVKTYRTGDTVMPAGIDLNSWALYTEAHDCSTNFVYISATFFTHNLDAALRPYLQLFLNLIIKSAIQRDRYIPSREVIKLIEENTVSTSSSIGISSTDSTVSCSQFSQTATLTIQLERSNYAVGANLTKDLLRNTIFEAGPIRDVAMALKSSAVAATGDYVTTSLDLLKTLYYKPGSNVLANSMQYQEKFLSNVAGMMDDVDTAKTVINNLDKLREFLLKNVALHITADFTELSKLGIDLNAAWRGAAETKELNKVFDWEVMVNGNTVEKQGEVIGLSTTDGSFVMHASPGVKEFNHTDVPPLLVALKYISQFEGPLWRQVRGPGYSYSYRLNLAISEGLIHFALLRASDVISGFNESMKIINDLSQPDADWDQNLISSAKGSAVFDIANRMPNLGEIHLQSIATAFKKVPPNHYNEIIAKIIAVTVDDLKRVAKLYISKIFSTTESKTIIICNIKDADDVSEEFEEYGFSLPVRKSWEESLFAKVLEES